MPRGVYDRSRARPRTAASNTNGRTSAGATISQRIAQLSKELAALSEEVKRSEGLQAAVAQYMAGSTTATAPRRRGRPPGSKNRPKTAAGATGTRRRRGRPPGSKNRPKVAAAASPPRRRGRPPKNAVPQA